jgi:hypothetical protein
MRTFQNTKFKIHSKVKKHGTLRPFKVRLKMYGAGILKLFRSLGIDSAAYVACAGI